MKKRFCDELIVSAEERGEKTNIRIENVKMPSDGANSTMLHVRIPVG